MRLTAVVSVVWAALVLPARGDDGDAALEVESAPTGDGGTAGGRFEVSGNLDNRYRFRTTSAGEDQDVYGYLNLDASYYPDERQRRPRFGQLNLNLQGSYNLDIDSFARSATANQGGAFFLPFNDATNVFPDRFRGFVHSAYAEVEDFALLDRLRLGRQSIHREAGMLFDGGYARTKPWKTVTLEAWGGLPAHLYETSASGDILVGGGIEARPLTGLTLGADYFFIRDNRKELVDSEEQVYVLRARYEVNREWLVSGSASWVDARDRRQVIDVHYASEAWGLLASLRVVRQNAVVGFQTSELSPYLFVMGEYEPYYEYQLDLYQPLGESFGVGGGAHVRHLEDPSDEGLYNHDFRNVYLSFDVARLWSGASASVRGDFWDSDADDIHAVGFELQQEVGEWLRVRLGTSYSLYRIDLFSGRERERDRVYYARFRWRLARWLDLDTDYQYERDSVTEYHTVTAGMTLWF